MGCPWAALFRMGLAPLLRSSTGRPAGAALPVSPTSFPAVMQAG